MRTTSVGRALQRTCLAYCRVRKQLVVRPLSTLWARLMLAVWGAVGGAGLCIYGRIRLYNAGELILGRRVRLSSGSTNNYVGGDRRLSLFIGPKGCLTIGDNCGISNSTIVCMEEVTLLPGTFIGGGCNLYDTDFHPVDAEGRDQRGAGACGPIRIGPRAFVGGHSTILKGVTIGEGAVIGAGSLVTRAVPPYEIWAGVPAKRIRSLSEQEHPH